MFNLNIRSLWPAFTLVGVLAVCALLPDDIKRILIFDRQLIADGDWWRLLTANLLHTNSYHLALNSAGVLVAAFSFYGTWSKSQWAGCYLFTALGSLLGLLLFHPDVVRYVGLSGCLHGVFIFGSIGLFKSDKLLSIVFTLGILAKVIWENINGAPQHVANMIEARVVVESHLWGTVTGLFLALVLFKALFKSKN